MNLSNCNINDIKTHNNDNIGMKSAYLYYTDFPLFFSLFINIYEYANYANMITCILDHEMNDPCLSFHLVQILVICGYNSSSCTYTPICESHFNVLINIYEYAN